MEAKNPLLSIIIPTLNEEAYLPALLESIKRQTFHDYEIIVADSNSTDRTAQLALAYGCRLAKGGLPAVGRNNGAKIARGDVLFFLDADVELTDIWFLDETMSEFKQKELDVASIRIRAKDGTAYDRFFYGFYNYYSVALERVLPHACGFCMLAKKSLHQAISGFDEDIKLAEDHDYARRAAKVGRYGHLLSPWISVSTRRFDRDGRLAIAAKYVLAEMYMLAVGPIKSDIFKYRWGYGLHKEK